MKLTAFGKELRSLRLTRLLRLKDMADAVGVSSSFLSAVENGDKEIPLDLPQRIASAYKLTNEELEKLNQSADEVRKNVTIPMPESHLDRYLIGSFARSLDSLDETRKRNIMELLRGNHE